MKRLLEENDIDILCMQETEVMKDIAENELKLTGYSLELEGNSLKSRVGFYISKSLNYQRKFELEGTDSNLIIIDVEGTVNTRIINVYRSFAPQNNISQREKFKYQLSLIKAAVDTSDCILLGDFNLNFDKKNDINYSHASYFDDFENVLSDKNMIQLIEFPTWSRIINNVLIESLLDHIYVKDPTTVCEIQSTKPLFGDHLLVSVTLRLERKVYVSSLRRDWRKYSKELLLSELSLVDWTSDVDNVVKKLLLTA